MGVAANFDAGARHGWIALGDELDNEQMARALLSTAMAQHMADDLAGAELSYRGVVALGHKSQDVLPILAGLVAARGATDEAIELWSETVRISPDNAFAHGELGKLLHGAGQSESAIASFQTSLGLDPRNAVVLQSLAVAYSSAGNRNRALEIYEELYALRPFDHEVFQHIRKLRSVTVAPWHIPMMNDVPRNAAFEKAIVGAVAERGADAQILDIGTGSGLLSMMAARAGAKHITTCEEVPAIANLATRIIAKNGYAERISLHKKKSTELTVGTDLPRPAEILISEILSSDLLGEGVLDTFNDAHDRLLAENATIIPQAATAMGCIVTSAKLDELVRVDMVSGFSMSEFSAYAPHKLHVHGGLSDWTRLSADVPLVAMDLTRKQKSSRFEVLPVTATADGEALGIVQWLVIDLGFGSTFSNHPEFDEEGGWLPVFHPFPEPIMLAAGDVLELIVGHDSTSIVVKPR